MDLTPADESFAARLRTVLPEAVLRPVEPRYLEEPRGLLAGRAGLLALPRDVGEVAALVAAARRRVRSACRLAELCLGHRRAMARRRPAAPRRTVRPGGPCFENDCAIRGKE